MLTRKPSRILDDAKEGNPAFDREGMPSAYAVVPPTTVVGPWHDDRDREACRMVSVNLSAYLDHELDPDQHNLITEHLDSCANCAALLEALEETDESVQREWRESAPLPSPSQRKQSIDSIMDALPPAPADKPEFAAKRVHARTRWTRFATGMSGILLAAGMLWSSYRLGYSHGRKSIQRASYSGLGPNNNPTLKQPVLSLSSLSFCSLTSPPLSRSTPTLSSASVLPSMRQGFR